MRTWTTPVGVAAATTLLLLATACGSDPATAGADTEPTTFEEALGLTEEQQAERQREVQEAVAACMEAQGFDYVPTASGNGVMRVSAFGGPSQRDDPEFRRTKGYGITTGGMMAARPDQDDDPNQAIRESLSEADREAYEKALFGQAIDVGEDGGGARLGIRARRVGGGGPGDEEGGGCFQQAQREVGDPLAELDDDMEEMQDRIEGDPRMVRANRDWAECMADEGYTEFQEPGEIPRHLIGQMNEILGNVEGGEGDGDRMVISMDETMFDDPRLAELQREEISLAGIDWECQEETGFLDVQEEVRAEAQQRFLDEHPSLGG